MATNDTQKGAKKQKQPNKKERNREKRGKRLKKEERCCVDSLTIECNH